MGRGLPAASESVAEGRRVKKRTGAPAAALLPAAADHAQRSDPRPENIELPDGSMRVSDDTAGQICRNYYRGRSPQEG
jgi:hypothetical protein